MTKSTEELRIGFEKLMLDKYGAEISDFWGDIVKVYAHKGINQLFEIYCAGRQSQNEATIKPRITEQCDAKVSIWLPRLLAEYEKQSRHNGFTLDTSFDMLRTVSFRRNHHISEQHAREICNRFIQWVNDFDDQRNATIGKWLDEEGRALLEKLNLEATEVSTGWRDVSIHGYPEKAMEVLLSRNNKTVSGAWIDDSFWYDNQRCAALYWMPLPSPPKPE